MSTLRVISDIHGNYNHFLSIIDETDYVVQLGDFGFDYTCLNKVDPNRVKIILGNHDNYDIAFDYPHMLGNFGDVNLGPFNFFYVRGGFSIDRAQRIKTERLLGVKTLWNNEELSYKQGMNALDLYESTKPDVMFSHDISVDVSSFAGNESILKLFGYKPDMITFTQELLQQMHSCHSPKLWCFAHFHKDFNMVYKGTRFLCKPEKMWIDFDENWCIMN